MSYSPPIRRLSSASSGSLIKQEELINAYEAEEERIINILSRKLEQLREEKINLENALEAESEAQVNKLNRELTVLRLAQQQQQQQQQRNGEVGLSQEARVGGDQNLVDILDPAAPSAEAMLDAMRRENDQLRNRLVDTERDYIRISRLNEIYREELIEHRRKLGLSVDNLIGLSSLDPYSQPTHRRSYSSSSASSPSTSVLALPTHVPRPAHGVPIPRQSSQIHRPLSFSERTTPPSHSPSSSESPFPFSPITSAHPASLVSNNTNATTPPSSASFNSHAALYATPARGLSYPSVPPPSLSSSFGSPTIAYPMMLHRDPSMSPVESSSRRNSNAKRGVAESGHLRSLSRGSVERGARIAETGTLALRSRAGSQSLAPTSEVTDAAEAEAESVEDGKTDKS